MNYGPFISEDLLLRQLHKLRTLRFYGRIVLSIENGQILRVAEERTLMKDDIEREILKNS